MLFSSMSFIYFFLPIILLLTLITKKEFHNAMLLIISIFFYAWAEPKYLLIMFFIVLISYFGAITIDKFPKDKKLTLILTILANLSFLIYFKYFNFIINNFNSLFNSNFHTLNIIMPLGISFYTFQALSYVFDVYKKDCNVQKNFYKLALYICLFPQLVAGPIVKYHDIEKQIDNREIDFDKINLGVKRFIIGLSKKVLIANTLGVVADRIFSQAPDSFSCLIAWLGSISYTLQLYFDFSGYCDMAIGLGLFFGFKFMENFNYPYISKSITEFWRRWHISLSTWFKQYVYIPLGGNRCSKIKTLRNLAIVFLLTGIWHGAQWTFIFWGIWHGFFIILEKLLNIKKNDKTQHSWQINLLKHIYCITIFLIGWVIFRAENLNYAFDYLKNMFNILNIFSQNFSYDILYYIDLAEFIVLIIAILCSTPLFKNLIFVENKIAKTIVNTWLLLLFYLSTIAIASDTYNPFIYFNF